MPKRLKIEKRHGNYEKICGLYDTEKDSRIKIRLLAIKYAYEDKKSEEIAGLLNRAGSSIRIYMKRWNRRGYEGLRDIPHPEVERMMTDNEMDEIDKALKGSPRDVGIERSNWSAPVLRLYSARSTQRTVICTSSFRTLETLKTSRSSC